MCNRFKEKVKVMYFYKNFPLDKLWLDKPLVYQCFIEYKNSVGSTSFSAFIDWINELRIAKSKLSASLVSLFEQERRVLVAYKKIEERCLSHLSSLSFIEGPNSFVNIQDNIEIGSGDFHNGDSTAIIKSLLNEKVVLKPIDGQITNAYFILIDWLNQHSKYKLKKFSVINKKDHHWMEFIRYEACSSQKEIDDYYINAGMLLCIVYLLNGSDFHYENIISNGTNPILIDHETLLQPKISSNIKNCFKKTEGFADDTVTRTFLLPNMNKVLFGNCGFGSCKQVQLNTLCKESINSFTDFWKVETKFSTQNLFKENIPLFNNQKVYPESNRSNLNKGFSYCYKLFLDNRKALADKISPLNSFQNKKLRFIWRPTNNYNIILNKSNSFKSLGTIKQRNERIEEYLSRAFKQIPKNHNLRFILNHEVAQLIRGDIPYFEINSSSRNLNTEFGVIKDFFELDCIENAHRKLKKLSSKDLELQTNIINRSLAN